MAGSPSANQVMIEVADLTRKYGRHTALDAVSFTVQWGEIVGLLGPNGAGKTTTMRILTGFISPTGGEVRVGGADVGRDPIAVRRRIGYLPEHCPLYPEMRVNEYLHYRGRLKGLGGRTRRRRVTEVKDLCGLGDVGRRIIGQLSKGYRQRIGLADALIHEPDLLILDEPTAGLDPNQIRQMRNLIRDLGRRHTILISSHILPEVEATAGRVLIIHKGRLVASDTPRNLKDLRADRTHIEAEIFGPRDEVVAACHGLPGVRNVVAGNGTPWVSVTIDAEAGHDVRPEIFDLVARSRWRLRELRLAMRSLEDVFEALTTGEQEDPAS